MDRSEAIRIYEARVGTWRALQEAVQTLGDNRGVTRGPGYPIREIRLPIHELHIYTADGTPRTFGHVRFRSNEPAPIIEPLVGTNFQEAVTTAIAHAVHWRMGVVLAFNGRRLGVRPGTTVEDLYREYDSDGPEDGRIVWCGPLLQPGEPPPLNDKRVRQLLATISGSEDAAEKYRLYQELHVALGNLVAKAPEAEPSTGREDRVINLD